VNAYATEDTPLIELHTISIGCTTWLCIHPSCDGHHHVFVSCAA
jgi:hypothetical protein